MRTPLLWAVHLVRKSLQTLMSCRVGVRFKEVQLQWLDMVASQTKFKSLPSRLVRVTRQAKYCRNIPLKKSQVYSFTLDRQLNAYR